MGVQIVANRISSNIMSNKNRLFVLKCRFFQAQYDLRPGIEPEISKDMKEPQWFYYRRLRNCTLRNIALESSKMFSKKRGLHSQMFWKHGFKKSKHNYFSIYSIINVWEEDIQYFPIFVQNIYCHWKDTTAVTQSERCWVECVQW